MKQSFPRTVWRSVTEIFPTANPHPLDDLTRVLVIGMGFSANLKTDERRFEREQKSNEEIADIMAELYHNAQKRGVEVHLLPQREVGEALQKHHSNVPIHALLKEFSEETHINSSDIICQAARYNVDLAQRIKDAIVVSHYAHATRSRILADLWGFRTRFPHRFAHSYAPESSQWWTRNAFNYFVWNVMGRISLLLLDYPHIPRNSAWPWDD